MSSDRIELWGGWSLVLPSPCETRRQGDGSWAAWDATHEIELSMIETSGTPAGPITPERMVAKGTESWEHHDRDGLAIRVLMDTEAGDAGAGTDPIEWSRVVAGATNTVLIMSVGSRRERDADWHERLWRSITPEPPKRGLLGRLRGR